MALKSFCQMLLQYKITKKYGKLLFKHPRCSLDEVTARNRVLAAAMLNSNANQAKLFSPTSYSPPTCHSALQAARNKPQNGAKFENGARYDNVSVKPIETSPKFSSGNFISELSRRFDKTSLNNNNVNDADGIVIGDNRESTRKLARTWSVGKLVNNFEAPSLTDNPSGQQNPFRDFRSAKYSVPSLPLSNGGSKPFVAPKPPALIGVAKPMLRHTVSTVCS